MVINLDQDLIKDQDKKQNTFESVNALYEGRKLIFFMLSEVEYFQWKKNKDKD